VKLLKIMTAELAVTFIAVAGMLFGVMQFFDVIPDPTTNRNIAFVLLFSSIAIVHSPAVTMALLSETGARGPVARTTLGVVLVSDVAVVLFFTAMLWVARLLVPMQGEVVPVIFVLWEIGGAIIVGALIGLVVAAYLRFVGRELMLFAVVIVFFGLELTRVLHVELLLTMLMAGFVSENFSQHGERLRHAMERSADPIFVVFFALSGAAIGLREVAPLLPLMLPLAFVRAGGLWLGVRVGGRWADASDDERKYVWLGLVSQVGVAIGLASIVAEAYPVLGSQLRSLLLALIAVNQTVGPVLFRRALSKSGEMKTGRTSQSGAQKASTGQPVSAGSGRAAGESPG
jgi:hypothetical protein